MINTHSISTFHSISMIPTHPATLTPPNASSTTDESPLNFSPNIQPILTKYQQVFSIPHGLPPLWPHDHHIHLTLSSSLVNIKPYRYPHFQKDAMATLIAEMLKNDIIQPSTSLYSSPVSYIRLGVFASIVELSTPSPLRVAFPFQQFTNFWMNSKAQYSSPKLIYGVDATRFVWLSKTYLK